MNIWIQFEWRKAWREERQKESMERKKEWPCLPENPVGWPQRARHPLYNHREYLTQKQIRFPQTLSSPSLYPGPGPQACSSYYKRTPTAACLPYALIFWKCPRTSPSWPLSTKWSLDPSLQHRQTFPKDIPIKQASKRCSTQPSYSLKIHRENRNQRKNH